MSRCYCSVRPGHEFVQTRDFAISDLGENPFQPCLGIDAIEPGGLNEGIGDGRGLTATPGADKETIFFYPKPHSGSIVPQNYYPIPGSRFPDIRASSSLGPGHNGWLWPVLTCRICGSSGHPAMFPIHQRPVWRPSGAEQPGLRAAYQGRPSRPCKQAQCA